ncbi:hypothetical protein, partial [Pedobacter suwonensis]|uniref:hypothetical protein n=1 Tax=Pedobacter suwonensis TaxID=332999 RepID=UPI001AD848E8
SLDAAAIKISVGFYKKRCKPWVFVSFGPSQKKEPLGGGEPRQARAKGKTSPTPPAGGEFPFNFKE